MCDPVCTIDLHVLGLFSDRLITFVLFPMSRAGGTAGAVITCPLEVVKTRLQSSVASFNNKPVYIPDVNNCVRTVQSVNYSTCTTPTVSTSTTSKSNTSIGLYRCLK